MRAKTLVVLALTVGALMALGPPASAGENLHVEVNKVVVGTAPPGTTFTVHFVCTDSGPEGVLSFDAEGNPVPANDNFFNAGLGSTCTITETETGGATEVDYSCEDDGVNSSCASSGNQVTFETSTSNNVTFTVTNTFTDEVPPGNGAAPAASTPTPATAVAGVPRLTG